MIGEQGWKPRTDITIVCPQYIELASTSHQPDIGLDRSLVETSCQMPPFTTISNKRQPGPDQHTNDITTTI